MSARQHMVDARMGRIWCGLCYEGVRHRAGHRHHCGERLATASREVRMGKFVGKKPEAGAVAPSAVLLPGMGVLCQCPALWEYLTLDKWEGGGKRMTSTVSLFVDDGATKLSLNDRAASRSCFITGESFEAALLLLEAALQENTVEWRVWKGRK